MLPDCSFQAVEKSTWSGRFSFGEPQTSGGDDGHRIVAFRDCRGMAGRRGLVVRDKEHGLRFKASTMKTVPPTTTETTPPSLEVVIGKTEQTFSSVCEAKTHAHVTRLHQ
jgi:hypothetical protein